MPRDSLADAVWAQGRLEVQRSVFFSMQQISMIMPNLC